MFISGGDFDITGVDIDDYARRVHSDEWWVISSDYEFNTYQHNFSEMYRDILTRKDCLDNYDDKYNKACSLIYENRFKIWKNADDQYNDPDEQSNDPNNSSQTYTVYQYNMEKCFRVDEDKEGFLCRLVILPSVGRGSS